MPRKEIVAATFITKLINHRGVRVPIYESDMPQAIEWLEPVGHEGSGKVLESCLPTALYAPYDEVIWEADGRVTLKESRSFLPVDYGKYPLTILNIDGAELEARQIAGRVLYIPKGIPVTVGLPLVCDEVTHRELRIEKAEEMVPSMKVNGLYQFRWVVKDVWVDRSPKEMEAISKALDALPKAEEEAQV